MKSVVSFIVAFFFLGNLSWAMPNSTNGDTATNTSHEYIDLGLSVLWATYNIGATNVGEYGLLYAWGETQPKESYSWTNYRYYANHLLTKYCAVELYGAVDSITILRPEDDAATQNWGGKWRMPTRKEMTELYDNCVWTWTEKYGDTYTAGYVGRSKINDNTIFLPAGGFSVQKNSVDIRGSYWTAEISPRKSPTAYYFGFYSNSNTIRRNERYIGQSVRAVRDK